MPRDALPDELIPHKKISTLIEPVTFPMPRDALPDELIPHKIQDGKDNGFEL